MFARTFRPSALVLIVLAALLAIVALSTLGAERAQAAPGDDTAPLFDMEFQNLPTDNLIYPTKNWWSRVTIQGMIAAENYRVDDVLVYMYASIDNNWSVSVNPLMFDISTTRLTMVTFWVYLHVPPKTIGPDESMLQITAVAKVQTRTLMEINITVNLNLLSNADKILDGMAAHVLVHDTFQVLTDTARLNNLLDEPQEFHICVIGEWADRIPEMDFQGGGIILDANEQRNVVYSGRIEGELEAGIYPVELALWTPDGEGGRTYIVNRTINMEVFTLSDDLFTSIMRVFIPIVITTAVAVAALITFIKMRRRRRLTVALEQYETSEQSSSHVG